MSQSFFFFMMMKYQRWEPAVRSSAANEFFPTYLYDPVISHLIYPWSPLIVSTISTLLAVFCCSCRIQNVCVVTVSDFYIPHIVLCPSTAATCYAGFLRLGLLFLFVFCLLSADCSLSLLLIPCKHHLSD